MASGAFAGASGNEEIHRTPDLDAHAPERRNSTLSRIAGQAQRVETISAKEPRRRWNEEEKRRLGTDVLGRINGTQPRGSTSCSPGIGKAGLPDWLHKRCLRGGDHGKRIEGIQAGRFI